MMASTKKVIFDASLLVTSINLLLSSCAMSIGMCATPIGQAVYGLLYQNFSNYIYVILFAVVILTALMALVSRKMFISLKESTLSVSDHGHWKTGLYIIRI